MRLDYEGGAPVLRTPGGGGPVRLRPGFVLDNRAEGTRTMPADIACTLDDDAFAARAEVVDPAGRTVAFDWAGPVRPGGADAVFTARMAAGFVNDTSFALALEFPLGPEDVLLAPGALHDGNRAKGLPEGAVRLSDTAIDEIVLPAANLALPGAGAYWPALGAGFFVAVGTDCALGAVGLSLRREPRGGQVRLAVTLPLRRATRRTEAGDLPVEPAGLYLGEGGAVATRAAIRLVDAADMGAYLEAVHELRQALAGGPARARLPLGVAAGLAVENLNERHWHPPIVLSGVGNPDGAPAPGPDEEGFPDDRRLRHGERGGAGLAYALSVQDDAVARARGVAMLDFIAEEGPSPSGLFYSLHNRWGGLGDPPWAHLRGATDACYWMLRAVGTHGGGDHPAWRDAALGCCDAFAALFADAGEFGYAAGRNADPAVWESGSAAGALATGCLALARRYCGREDLLDVATRAGAVYARELQRAAAGGGVFEAGRAPDSRSAAALLESWLLLYEETHEKAHLAHALAAADLLSLYVLAHDAAWPPASDLGRMGLETRGSVLRSVAEPRLGPGLGGHSPAGLLRLYRASGEGRVLALAEAMVRALPQYVTPYHAALGELRRGMAVSDLPLPDHAAEPGTVREESRADTALDLLLARTELPGVYLDPPRSCAAAFDHLDLRVDWDARRAEVTNPTPYPAAGIARVEVDDESTYRLPPGGTVTLTF